MGQSVPVPGDYDGSGHIELAVYIPSFGAFIYHSAITGKDVIVPIGTANSGEIPAPGVYDSFGKTEVAIYDPKGGFFEYQPSIGGGEVILPFGGAGNGAIPLASTPGMVAASSGSVSAEAVRPAFVTPGSAVPTSVSTVTTVASKAAVPSGPMAALARVPRSLVNQGIDDPSLFTT